MISISLGDASDIASIMPVMNDAFDPSFGEAWTSSQCMSLLAIPGSKLIMARKDNICIGFALTRYVLDEEELLMIGVSPAFQRDKVGSQILGIIINDAKAANRSKLFLEVREGNNAQYFYRSSGFLDSGCRKNYYKGSDGQLFDAITMVYLLS
jgi:[ribosomal protein S18]-alanine N-acetyltransferase